MSTWLIIVILAYFILALVNLADKFIIDNIIKSSRAYTFLVGLAGGLVWLAAPWYLAWPDWTLFWSDLLIGALFPVGLLLLYRSLKIGEASRVIVVAGAAVPIFSFGLSIAILHETFSVKQLTALGLLILGTVVIAWLPPKHKFLAHILSNLGWSINHGYQAVLTALGAAAIFALFFVGSKVLFLTQPFTSAFIWIRLGSVVAVLSFLLFKSWRREIFKNFKKLHGNNAKLFAANQLFAATGFTLQNYAVAIGSVALVNALQAVQYALLIIFAAILTLFYPRLIKEKITSMVIAQKIAAVALIAGGLYLLL